MIQGEWLMASDSHSRKIYNTMVSALKNNGWNFSEAENGELVIYSACSSEDLRIQFTIRVDSERQVIQFLSMLPFTFAQEKCVDASIAICVANYGMVNGVFDYNYQSGKVIFRLTTSFVDCEFGEQFFMLMMATAIGTIDQYNDKFYMLSKGTLTLEEFIKMEESNL